MLGRFIEFKGYKRIPNTGNTFEINLKGKIRNIFTQKELAATKSSSGELIVTGAEGEWFNGLALAVVMGITFRNVVCHPRLWSHFKVLYKDDNPENTKFSNTLWQCPEGNLTLPEMDGFCVIPGLSRYLINRDGKLWSTAKGAFLAPYQDANGYWMFGVQPDVGARTIIGQHRLLCLAFKPYPVTVDKLDVNHLDGVTSNNPLDNLEWATRSRNNLHAYEHRLRDESQIVQVRSVKTGTVRDFFSYQECGRALGLSGGAIRLRVKTQGQITYPPGLQFKLASDETSWSEIIDLGNLSSGRKVRITSPKGNVLIRESAKDAARFFGTTHSGIHWHLKHHGSSKPYHGHTLEYIDPLDDIDSPLTW